MKWVSKMRILNNDEENMWKVFMIVSKSNEIIS